MATATLNRLVRNLRQSFEAGQLGERPDAELLDRFLYDADGSAFEALVRRHAPLVLAACRKVLTDESDVEDAFQATFLVLLRSAKSIRSRESVGSWLYGVAHRVAVRARVSAARRKRHEEQAGGRAGESAGEPDLSWRDAVAVLHEELNRLPECYRMPLLLCYLEGKSRDEAAKQLGWSEQSVKGRLERGREALRQRLSRRGIALSAGLLAVLSNSPAASGLPPRLVRTVVEASRSGPRAAVAALAQGVAPVMSVKPVKLAAAVLLAVALSAAGAVGLFSPESPANAADTKAAAVPDKNDESTSVTYAGRVTDSGDKPVAGAKLYLFYYSPKQLPVPVRATSDADGKFRFTVAKADFDASAFTDDRQPWDATVVVARADGYGVGWMDRGAALGDLSIRMSKDDVPVKGRVVDLEGKPIAGVSVKVRGLMRPAKGDDLAAFQEALKERKDGYGVQNQMTMGLTGNWMGRDSSVLFPDVTTDADGRFTINGVGRERMIALRIEGPNVEMNDIHVMTRPCETITVPEWRNNPDGGKMTYHGPTFSHVAAPCLTVEGVVTDKDTGKPIPGAVVTTYKLATSNVHGRMDLKTVADKDGRYRVTGLPPGPGNLLRAGPSDSEPYVLSVRPVPAGDALKPITLNFPLKRGVWVEGKAADKVTGKPVHGRIEYFIYPDNPNIKEAAGFTTDPYYQNRADDGSFRFVALPGKVLIAFRAIGDAYLIGSGVDKVTAKKQNEHFETRPHLCYIEGYHAYAEVDAAAGSDPVRCDVVLDPGVTVKGTVVGPDGKPVAGAKAFGLKSYASNGYWEHAAQKTPEFTVLGLAPGQKRRLIFLHEEKKLVGTTVVGGDTNGAVTVKLEPAGSVTGRYVDEDGRPKANATLMFLDFARKPGEGAGNDHGSHPAREFRSDAEGRFRIEGLAPGLKYSLAHMEEGRKLGGYVFKDLTVTSAESKDLGDLKSKPIKFDE
jgi:RNA polymerase sigma factor (sigma-70 family)